MEPVEFDDGYGFRTVVELETGDFALVSEVHRALGGSSLDETLVFRCDAKGNITDWGDVYGTSSTQDAIAGVDDWCFLST
jgi:hypothetical protein